jgi:hypothetical protein
MTLDVLRSGHRKTQSGKCQESKCELGFFPREVLRIPKAARELRRLPPDYLTVLP